MYLREIVIRQIKCFNDLRLNFVGEDGQIRRWTTLIGENGLGKTTLLMGMALPLAGPDAYEELLANHTTQDWAPFPGAIGRIRCVVELAQEDGATFDINTPLPFDLVFSGSSQHFSLAMLEENRVSPYAPNIKISTVPQEENPLSTSEHTSVSKFELTFPLEGVPAFAAGYGPFRRLSGGSEDANRILQSQHRASRFVTLFREDAAISDLERWLVDLRNLSRDQDFRATRNLEFVKNFLQSGFFIEPITLELTATTARLRFPGGPALPLIALSDGYRAMLALGLDLLRGLLLSFPDAEDPTRMQGVVLIDELDAHLHPRWQRELGLWLQDRFPKLQFIVATHSPFLAQAAPAGGNILLKKDENGKVIAEPKDDAVATWRAEQILTGLFGLNSTRSPATERKLARMVSLERKVPRNTVEEAEYHALQNEFNQMPSLQERHEDRQTLAMLRRLVDQQTSSIKDLE